MKAKLSIQKHSALLTRFALICGFVIAVTWAGPAGVAQENHEHHQHSKIYKVDVNGSTSPLLDLLSRDYSIINFDKLTPPFELYPVLIGPDALANQAVTAYLVRAYRAGLTVAIVHATQQQANLFDELVEGEQAASCLPSPGVADNRTLCFTEDDAGTARGSVALLSTHCFPGRVALRRIR